MMSPNRPIISALAAWAFVPIALIVAVVMLVFRYGDDVSVMNAVYDYARDAVGFVLIIAVGAAALWKR